MFNTDRLRNDKIKRRVGVREEFDDRVNHQVLNWIRHV